MDYRTQARSLDFGRLVGMSALSILGAMELISVASPANIAATNTMATTNSTAPPSYTMEISEYCAVQQIATDITGCAQQAIDAAASKSGSYGGAIIHFPSTLSPYKLLGTLRLPASFVTLLGDGPQATFISCANGANDCIQIGGTQTQTRDQAIEKIGIWGSNKTGGSAINVYNTFNVRISDSLLNSVVGGVNLSGRNNSVNLRDVLIVLNQNDGQFGIYWHDRADGGARSDVLTMNNVTVEGSWSNASGLLWDGMCNTLVGESVRILHSKYGMRIINSAQSTQYYPSFLSVFALELEGFKTRALSIEAGNNFKIVGSDINNLRGGIAVAGHSTTETDDYAIAILPDTGYSYTRAVVITGTRIGDNRLSGVYSNALDVQLSNDIFYSTSAAGVNAAPVIHIGASSRDTILDNIECEEFGGLAQASYCLQVDAGAQGFLASGIDAHYVRTGAVNDLGAASASFLNVLGPSGKVQSW
jgi:hypothetical protein